MEVYNWIRERTDRQTQLGNTVPEKENVKLGFMKIYPFNARDKFAPISDIPT